MEIISDVGRNLLKLSNIIGKDSKAHRSKATGLMTHDGLMVEFGKGCE